MKYFNFFITIVTIVACQNSNFDKKNDDEEFKNITLDSNPSIKILNNDNFIDSVKGILFIKKFYKEVYTDEGNQLSRKNYIDISLLKKIDSLSTINDNLQLDYDPFIREQDYSEKSINKTIRVKIKNYKENIYKVTFNASENSKNIHLDLKLKKSKNDSIKILNILNDDIINTQ